MPITTDINEILPDWLLESVRLCRPPDNLTVSEFCNRHYLLDRANSVPFKLILTPYLKEIMDAFTDPEVEEIIFQKPTQVGGTRSIFNMLAYLIVQDPDDAMIVYPTLELAEYTSKNRIRTMIEASPVLRDLYLPMESSILEYHFSNGMTLTLAGANSAASLASRPIRYLFLDEIDKYPTTAGKEANPINLAIERTKTFPHNKKIVMTSTPESMRGNISKRVKSADSIKEYGFSCQSCGVEQVWEFGNVKWTGKDHTEARETAYYLCPHCNNRINDSIKSQLVQDGCWINTEVNHPGKRSIAFKMNTLPSPWVRIGDMAAEYLKTKDDPDEYKNFVNSWEGKAYEQSTIVTSQELVLERQTELEEGTIPSWARLLTAGIDFQKDCFYWTIRAWGARMTSQNIAHGIALEWDDVEFVMNQQYPIEGGAGVMEVNLAGLDSGNDTETVEDLHMMNQQWTILLKGASHKMNQPYAVSSVKRIGSRAMGMRLIIVNTERYKNLIASRLNRPNGKGSWMVYKNCDVEYAKHIVSEKKLKVKKGSVEVETWTPITKGAANHYLDCEVYAAVAAELMQVRFLTDETEAQAQPEVKNNTQNKQSAGSNWVNNQQGWQI
ncbi:MAG: terminase gpA endonuclease subunit [Legionellales bacterium]|jgi:phage terminase large subunit GpA-like protein